MHICIYLIYTDIITGVEKVMCVKLKKKINGLPTHQSAPQIVQSSQNIWLP